jgi:hypothetical protein
VYLMYIPFKYNSGSLAWCLPQRESSDPERPDLSLTEWELHSVVDDSSPEELPMGSSVCDEPSLLLELTSYPELGLTQTGLVCTLGTGHSLV